MNCRKARKWISLDLDGELSPRRKAPMDAHLETCASCRSQRAAWAAMGVRMRSRPIPEARTAEAAWADVRRAIRTSAPEPVEAVEAGWAFGRRFAWAAGLAIVLSSVLLWHVVDRSPTASPLASASGGKTEVEWVETGLPGATPMVYEDAESGLVVIWVVEAGPKEKLHAGS